MLDNAKPRETMNDFDSAKARRDGGVDLVNSRFKTRVRRSHQQVGFTLLHWQLLMGFIQCRPSS